MFYQKNSWQVISLDRLNFFIKLNGAITLISILATWYNDKMSLGIFLLFAFASVIFAFILLLLIGMKIIITVKNFQNYINNSFIVHNQLKIMLKVKIFQLIASVFFSAVWIFSFESDILKQFFAHIFFVVLGYTYLIFIFIGIFTSLLFFKIFFQLDLKKNKSFLIWLSTIFPIFDLIIVGLLIKSLKHINI